MVKQAIRNKSRVDQLCTSAAYHDAPDRGPPGGHQFNDNPLATECSDRKGVSSFESG
jgi:hypothetical protein